MRQYWIQYTCTRGLVRAISWAPPRTCTFPA